MNRCAFYGRISQSIELKTTSGEKPVTFGSFSVAVKRNGRDSGTDFFRFTAFGKTAENISKYFSKGSRIVIDSHAQMNNYTDRDGNKRSSLSFIVDSFDFVDTKAESQSNPQSAPQATGNEDFLNIPDNIGEGLPFA